MRLTALLLVSASGCAGLELPRYGKKQPPPLPASQTSIAKDAVRLELRPFSWHTFLSSGRNFRLGLPSRPLPSELELEKVGGVRSADHYQSAAEYEELQCAWQEKPVGETKVCDTERRRIARAQTRPRVAKALAELRERAGRGGAEVVRAVRCYGVFKARRSHMWCEGIAYRSLRRPQQNQRSAIRASAQAPSAAPERAPSSAPGQAPSLAGDLEFRSSRLTIGAGPSFSMFGADPVLGSTLNLRYRPIEIALHVISALGSRTVGLGAQVAWRKRLHRETGFGLYSELAAYHVNDNGGDVRNGSGLYTATAGISIEPRAIQIWDKVRVFAHLGGGYAFGKNPSESADRDLRGVVLQSQFGLIWAED